MQLDTGKSRHGLVGTLRNIIKEEGYVGISHDHLSANCFGCIQGWPFVQRYVF